MVSYSTSTPRRKAGCWGEAATPYGSASPTNSPPLAAGASALNSELVALHVTKLT